MISPQVWRQAIEEDLQLLGDAVLQRKSWIEGSAPVVSSFPEVFNHFLDMLNPASFMDEHWRSLGLSTKQYQMLKAYELELSSYRPPKGDYDHAAILADPQWNRLQELAKLTWQQVFADSRVANE